MDTINNLTKVTSKTRACGGQRLFQAGYIGCCNGKFRPCHFTFTTSAELDDAHIVEAVRQTVRGTLVYVIEVLNGYNMMRLSGMSRKKRGKHTRIIYHRD